MQLRPHRRWLCAALVLPAFLITFSLQLESAYAATQDTKQEAENEQSSSEESKDESKDSDKAGDEKDDDKKKDAKKPKPKAPLGTNIGEQIKDIEGTDVEGEEFMLSDYEGKVIMLDFWGDW